MKPSGRIKKIMDKSKLLNNEPIMQIGIGLDEIVKILDEQDERIKKLEEQMDKIYIAYNSNLHPHTKSFLEDNK